MKINTTHHSAGMINPVCANPGFIKTITFIIFFTLLSASANSQDLLKLKSGREIKVEIIEESSADVKYKEFENPSGPVYTITRDKIETIKYKKGGRETQESEAKESKKATIKEPITSAVSTQDLTVKKRYVYKDGIKQSSRSIKTIMEDHPEAIGLYESGKMMCDLSNLCAIGVIATSFAASQIANKQEEDADRKRISAIGLSIDGAFIITAIILSSSGKQKIRKSVSLYNSATGKPVSYNMSFGLQENGIGIGFIF